MSCDTCGGLVISESDTFETYLKCLNCGRRPGMGKSETEIDDEQDDEIQQCVNTIRKGWTEERRRKFRETMAKKRGEKPKNIAQPAPRKKSTSDETKRAMRETMPERG